ncbi:hypothetical protein [Paracoccus sanguinis]|uniref:Uncharacterized protein n=1 Tax=Paracoccus sanguinis TaxID=1545044 RepID=A0A1H2ZWQ0_9RHOB|nr:hypothetical protein [Paracoccus sanguinis]SDX21089.1 hypothetical protein SAMN05444276_103233 [Paracoccus sanguinis]
MIDVPPRSRAALVSQACICAVIAVSLAEIVHPAPALGWIAGAAIAVYFALEWRRFTLASWVPVGLSAALLALALARGVAPAAIEDGLARMAFLASLLALLGILRVVAGDAPAIAEAGRYLTAQPPGRRYLALASGGNIFGLLINLGGLAILLEMAVRALDADTRASAAVRAVRLRRMTVAVLRGFSLLPLWSPFGFGMNTLLLAMPGLSYARLGPPGIAVALVFLAAGWVLDRATAPARTPGVTPAHAEPGDRAGLIRLILHVAALGALVFAIGEVARQDFQHALLLAVPAYSLGWAAVLGRHQPGGAGAAVRRTAVMTVRRFPLAAGEIAIFASAGLLSVLALELIPVERVQALVASLHASGGVVIVALNLTLFGLASLGINPIITAAVAGALVTRLDIPGLTDLAAALSLAGSWSLVMIFSPVITTVAYAAALVGQTPITVGPRWNGVYCLAGLALWTGAMAGLVTLGWV